MNNVCTVKHIVILMEMETEPSVRVRYALARFF